MSEWRDIESAPKDGTMVILKIRHFVMPGMWLHPEDAHKASWYAWMQWFGITALNEPSVTHWMPLPEPPEVKP